MPSFYNLVDAPSVNILDTVANQVITGLISELGLTTTFENALYIVKSFSSNSAYDDGNGAPKVSKRRCDVDVHYIIDKSQVPWPNDTSYNTTANGMRSDKKMTHTPILVDQDANVYIENTTAACGIEMSFTMSFETYDEAVRAFDSIQTRYKGSLVQRPFDIDFSYPVGKNLLMFLFFVYKSKSQYADKTFFDYVNDYKSTEISFDIRKSQLTDPNADRELMIRAGQLNSMAQLTMDQREPEAVMQDQLADYFTINFTFVVQFGRPDVIIVHTPVSIENNLVPQQFFANAQVTYHYNPDVAGLYQDLTIHETMQRSYGDFNRSGQIIRLPEYDDWYTSDAQYQKYKYRPLLIAHFTLDGPITQIDLNNIPGASLNPVVKQIMVDTKDAIFDYGGLLQLGVYADDLRLGTDLVSLDENLILTVQSTRPDRCYHLILSETTDLYQTDSTWNNVLLKYRYFFPLTIERNLNRLITQRMFVVRADDYLLTIVNRMNIQGVLGNVLRQMVADGETDQSIFGYTQNATQLLEYLAITPSERQDFVVPDDPILQEYYSTIASPESRSLLVVFIEWALLLGELNINDVPEQYLQPNPEAFPYLPVSGGYYGFNTPLRILNVNTNIERHSQ